MAYVNTDELSISLGQSGGDIGSLDIALLQQAADTATAIVDNYCGRRFAVLGNNFGDDALQFIYPSRRDLAYLPYPIRVPSTDYNDGDSIELEYFFYQYPENTRLPTSGGGSQIVRQYDRQTHVTSIFMDPSSEGFAMEIGTDVGQCYLGGITRIEEQRYFTTFHSAHSNFILESDMLRTGYSIGLISVDWGLLEIPAPVKRATLLAASRLYRRQDSPLGVTGFGDLGAVFVRSVDPDVAKLLDPYRKQVWVG